MRNFDNDNDPLPFITIGLAAERMINKLSASEIPVDFPRGRKIGGVRAVRRIEPADRALPSVNADSSNPFSANAGTFTDALKAGSIALAPALIGLILSWSCFSQIRQTIIERVAIDVVNQAARPSAVHIKPSKSMGEVTLPIDHYSNTTADFRPSNRADPVRLV